MKSNKLNKKNRKKHSVRKRRTFTSAVLAGSLIFGNSKIDYLKPQNDSNATINRKKVISAQELNSLDDFHNSSQIVRTGNGTIFEFQREVSDASLNKILFERNLNEPDGIILVKYDGILPGAEGFSLKYNPRRRHQFGRPRMRGTGINVDPHQNIQGLGNIPEAPKVRPLREVNTGLDAIRGTQCPTQKFDMQKQHENFMQEISEKGYKLECSQERFNELSTNPQTDSIDEKSLIEAKGGLQGEAQGMYNNIRRPGNKAVDLDFEIDSSKGYTHVDYKTPVDFQDLADKKGIDVSNFPSLQTVAYNMGKKIPIQKEQFCGLTHGPKSPENVLHVVNLDLIRNSNQKQDMMNSVLKGVEHKGVDTAGIYFLNYL